MRIPGTLLVLMAVLVASAGGCANGPLRRMFRGAPCSTCNPPLGRAFGNAWAGNTATNCESGVCGVNSAPPAPLSEGTVPTTSARYPTDGYPYPGNPPAQVPALNGLSPLDSSLSPGRYDGATGSGLGGSLNGYVNPPTPGTLPGPGNSR